MDAATMPATWDAAITAVTNGVGSTMTAITGNVLLTALVFGFLFIRKTVGLLKRFVKLGGKN